MIRVIIIAILASLAFVIACSRETEEPAETQTEVLDLARQPAQTRDAIGRHYHYVRTNIDGANPMNIHIFRERRDLIEVLTVGEKCAPAKIVRAEIDVEAGYARNLTGGRLTAKAQRENYAFVNYDPETHKLTVRIESPNLEPMIGSVIIEQEPWHLYDFDLASLVVMTPNLADATAGFSFGLPLVIAEPGRNNFVLYLGEAVAAYRGEDVHVGRPAHRYALGGSAFGAYGGSLWLDAEEGHILDAEAGIPNHLDYSDFKLRLVSVDDEGGAAAWRKLLITQVEGCE